MKKQSRYYMMLRPKSREQGQRFKKRCREQGLSMNTALTLLMSGVINDHIGFKQKAIVRPKR